MTATTFTKGGHFLMTPVGSETIFTREDLSQDTLDIGAAANEFIQNEVMPVLDKLEKKENICPLNAELLKKAGELGLLGIDIAEEFGGANMGLLTAMYCAEMTAPSASFAVSLMAHNGIGLLPLAWFGSKELKDKYLAKMVTGEMLAAYCLTEPSYGSDALHAKTTANLSADGTHYVMNGGKMWITNGGFADILTVYAQVDGDKFSAFMVEAAAPGVGIGAEEDKMGLKGSSTRAITFDDVKVPVENLLGEVGKGHQSALGILDIGRLKLGVGCIGSGKLAIALAAKYANERKQFNQPISNFGMIRRKFADMAVKVFDLESIAYRTSAYLDEALHGLPADDHSAKWHDLIYKTLEQFNIECSILKVYGSEVQAFIADTALQVYGGYGFSNEYPAARMYRDERVFRIFEGTNEVNRMVTVGTLLKRAMKGEIDFMGALNSVLAEIKAGIDLTPKAGVLGYEAKAVEIAKKLGIYTAGCVVQKHMANLADKNYMLGAFEYPMEDLANIMMDVFVMESNLYRVQQYIEKNGEEKAKTMLALAKVSINEKLVGLFATCHKVLGDVADGDNEAFGRNKKALDRLAFNYVVNLTALKDEVASKIIAEEKYNLF